MRRRALLLALGSAATLSGCGGTTEETPGQRSPGRTPTDVTPAMSTATTADTESPTDAASNPYHGLAVEDIVVRKAARYESQLGSGGVLAGPNQQYVVATVRHEGEGGPTDFAFETAAGRWEPGLADTRGSVNRSVAGHGGGPVGYRHFDDGRAYLAFVVPSPLEASEARITYLDAVWPLPPAARERLVAQGPEFELTGLSVPATVTRGDPLEVSLSVRNAASSTGRFLAAVHWPTRRVADDDESQVVERQVSAGTAFTEHLTLGTAQTTAETASVTLTLEGSVNAERSVEVRTR